MRSVFILTLTAALIIAALRCSGPSELAGATGSGNPGGPVKVCLVADTGLSENALLKKVAHPVQRPGVEISDAGNLSFSIDSMNITVQRILFILSDLDCQKALEGFNDSCLTCDSGSLALEGPFVFDLHTGKSQPALDSFRLPEADYIGIRFETRNTKGAGSQDCPMYISGIFNYDTSHAFSFLLNSFSFTLLRKGPPARVSRNDTTSFILTFAARHWLDFLDLGSCLDGGHIRFQNDGSLLIDQNSPKSGPCMNTEAVMRRNIQNSAALKILSMKKGF